MATDERSSQSRGMLAQTSDTMIQHHKCSERSVKGEWEATGPGVRRGCSEKTPWGRQYLSYTLKDELALDRRTLSRKPYAQRAWSMSGWVHSWCGWFQMAVVRGAGWARKKAGWQSSITKYTVLRNMNLNGRHRFRATNGFKTWLALYLKKITLIKVQRIH